MQSLLVTCRLHRVDPYAYLVDVLQRVGQHPASRVAELTPLYALLLGRPTARQSAGMAQFDLLELARAYRDAEHHGEVPILIVRPAWTEMGDPFAAVPEVAQRALVLEQDEQQRDRTELDYGISGHVLYWPAGFLIDAQGRIAGHRLP